jgi:hypothetical protein
MAMLAMLACSVPWLQAALHYCMRPAIVAGKAGMSRACDRSTSGRVTASPHARCDGISPSPHVRVTASPHGATEQGRFFYMQQRLKEAGEATPERALADLKGLRHLKWLDQRAAERRQQAWHPTPAGGNATL